MEEFYLFMFILDKSINFTNCCSRNTFINAFLTTRGCCSSTNI